LVKCSKQYLIKQETNKRTMSKTKLMSPSHLGLE
jgi:hypothetical protein